MKSAKEFLENKEQKLIKIVGLKEWEDNKVYFPYEVINFMEEYAKITIEEPLPDEKEEYCKCKYFAGTFIDIDGVSKCSICRGNPIKFKQP